MKMIRQVVVKRFKSVREAEIASIGDFTVLAGLNNAGKSNFLRALHAFFSDEIEPHVPINIDRDYFRPALRSKSKKEVEVSVEFNLPSHFNFRSELRSTEKLLGREFTLTKKWNKDSDLPLFYLNNDKNPLSLDDQRQAEQFFKLVSLRYIPNRVIPTDVVRQEQESLRDVLVRRLARYKKETQPVFDRLKTTAESLIGPLSKQILGIVPDVDAIRLATATSMEELALRFGYSVTEFGAEMNEDEQGSGMQSLLMFQTLYLIDLDFYQRFGWKQASIWLVEEPESSLHTALEAHIGRFLAQISKASKGRLQTIATTHSDVMIQYSDSSYLIERTKTASPISQSGTSAIQHSSIQLLRLTARHGISRWVNPILRHPLDPIVLVEGKHDARFIDAALKMRNAVRREYRIVTVGDLVDKADHGGAGTMKEFIRVNSEEIATRSSDAPIIAVLDWEVKPKEVREFLRLVRDSGSYTVLKWDERHSNPGLADSFRGIERFYSARIVLEGDRRMPNVLLSDGEGVRHLKQGKEKDDFKKVLFDIVNEGMEQDDLKFATPFIELLERTMTPR